MFEKTAVLKLTSGLQARAAAQFVQLASQYEAEITIKVADRQANAKSVMGLMGLAIRRGRELTILAEGPDAEAAIASLVAFIEQED